MRESNQKYVMVSKIPERSRRLPTHDRDAEGDQGKVRQPDDSARGPLEAQHRSIREGLGVTPSEKGRLRHHNLRLHGQPPAPAPRKLPSNRVFLKRKIFIDTTSGNLLRPSSTSILMRRAPRNGSREPSRRPGGVGSRACPRSEGDRAPRSSSRPDRVWAPPVRAETSRPGHDISPRRIRSEVSIWPYVAPGCSATPRPARRR